MKNLFTREDNHRVWCMKLYTLYTKLCNEIYTNHNVLLPWNMNFSILTGDVNRNGELGNYNTSSCVIALHEVLFTNYAEGAVEHVLRHEICHMIVDRLWNLDSFNNHHGEAFKRACGLLGIDDNRLATPEMLSFGTYTESSIVDKIRKLLLKGHDSGISCAESELFLKKAYTLMSRNRIDMSDVCGRDKFYTYRPVGGSHKRMPTWISQLGVLLTEYYHVRAITIRGEESHLELFGTPENLDLAEQIFYSISNQGIMLYRSYRDNPTRPSGMYGRRCSSNSFMCGLIHGFRKVLERTRRSILEDVSEDNQSLLLLNDPILEQHYRSHYTRISKISHSSIRGSGYHAGKQTGSNLSLRAGMTSGVNNGRYLGS